MIPLYQKRASDTLDSMRTIGEIDALCVIPQSPPHHAEGGTISAHLLRALTALEGIAAGVSILFVEEFVRERQLEGFFLRLEKTIKENTPLLRAYILCHDLGKQDTATHDGTCWHYPQHAHVGAAEAYAAVRSEILSRCGVEVAHAKMLRELVRYHMQIIARIEKTDNVALLHFLENAADRQGIHTKRFLALLPACLFLDAICGSLTKQEEQESAQTSLLIAYAKAEREACPSQAIEDNLLITRKRRTRVREILRGEGLDFEEIFKLLHTPFGEARGPVARALTRYIKNIADDQDAAVIGIEYAEIIAERAAEVRRRLEEEGLLGYV